MKILNIPKLDLTQAKIIQEINAKKITPQPNMNNVDPKLQEKIRKFILKILFLFLINFKKKYLLKFFEVDGI